MPSPKDGTVNNLVNPAPPRAALEADKADPGEMAKLKTEQQESGAGKYGSTELAPQKKSSQSEGENNKDQDEEKKKSWIAIKMVNEIDEPVPGVHYKITLPDGETLAEGTLDEQGYALVKEIDPGTCKIAFPDLDQDAWEPK